MGTENRLIRVLHITGNYPDGVFDQPTTEAVKNLVSQTDTELTNFVVSIRRLHTFRETTRLSGNVLSLGYPGMPALLGQSIALRRLRNRIVREVRKAGFEYDVIHAHKVAVEGIVAYLIAERTAVPYVVTVRPYTDSRVLRWRPDCRRLIRRVMTGSRAIFLTAPWAKGLVERQLNTVRSGFTDFPSVHLLPNIVKYALISPSTRNQRRRFRFVTVFREGQGRAKGFEGLLAGVRVLIGRGHDVELEVIGCAVDGQEGRWVADSGLQPVVKFLGRASHGDTLRQIADADALVLASRNDTFGMVYVEALLAGVPVLYSRNAGIDGYLDGFDVGVRVDPYSNDAIASAMEELLLNGEAYRARLRACLESGQLDFFRAPEIIGRYVGVMKSVAVAPSTGLFAG